MKELEAGRIGILPPEVARRIAAGEVIERPASVVRELLENAADAGAASVSLSLRGGGLEEIRVSDDGRGIAADDFPLLARPPAPSKIRVDDDLLKVASLGFRGEALASIAAVADLEIISSTDGRSASRLRSSPGRPPEIGACAGRRGTSVTVTRLFDSFPARKRFLKRAQTESALATQVFIDRALPQVGMDFRLSADGQSRLLIPASALKARVMAAYPMDEPESFFLQAGSSIDGMRLEIVYASPEVLRPDRRHLQCFVNRRRVQDFSLQKALELGYSGYLPGGLFPFAFLFLEIDPADVDFNIHPAKKELRFRDPRRVQEAVIKAMAKILESEFGGRAIAASFSPPSSEGPGLWSSSPHSPGPMEYHHPTYASEPHPRGSWAGGDGGAPPPAMDALSIGGRLPYPENEVDEALVSPSIGDTRVIGQALGTFILFETPEGLYFLDQHAAHERIIFDHLSAAPPRVQPLLIPLPFRTSGEEEEAALEATLEGLAEAGFSIVPGSDGDWLLSSHPEAFKGDPSGIVDDLRAAVRGPDPAREARALAACRAAVKEGESLDMASMEDLVQKALALPEKRCPHGRPILFRLSRQEAYYRIRRAIR